jgi:hypothetical protein
VDLWVMTKPTIVAIAGSPMQSDARARGRSTAHSDERRTSRIRSIFTIPYAPGGGLHTVFTTFG